MKVMFGMYQNFQMISVATYNSHHVLLDFTFKASNRKLAVIVVLDKVGCKYITVFVHKMIISRMSRSYFIICLV